MRTEIKTRDGEVLSFWAPDAGGYVYRETDDRPCRFGAQVCDGLAERGSTPAYSAGQQSRTRPARWSRAGRTGRSR